MTVLPLCSVCGEPVEPYEEVRIPATGAVVHGDTPESQDGCEGRYWWPPGEAGLTEESW